MMMITKLTGFIISCISIVYCFILTLLSTFYQSSSSSSLAKQNRPKLNILVAEALSTRDLGLAMSVMRLARSCNGICQSDITSPNHFKYQIVNNKHRANKYITTKRMNSVMKNVWFPFAETMAEVHRIIVTKPELNIYTQSFLDPSRWNQFVCLICFFFQLLCSGIVVTESVGIVNNWIAGDLSLFFSIPECYFMTPVVILYFGLLMMTQSRNSKSFFVIFYPADGIMTREQQMFYLTDFFVNRFLIYVLLAVNGVIMAASETRMDIVMNCLAIVFIVELDDSK